MRRGAHMADGLTALVIVGLAGCVSFRDRPLVPEQIAADFEARSLEDPGLRQYVGGHLQHPFASWDLSALTLAALYFHPEMDVARAQLESAQAAQITAGERPNPTLGISPAYNSTTKIPSPWIVAPSLDFPIETAGKRGYRLAQASHLSDAARFRLGATAWQVRSRLRRSCLALHGARLRETALKEQEAIQAGSLRLLEDQLRAGAVPPYELTRSRVALNQTRFALQDAEKQAAQALIQMADALGLPPRALEGAGLDLGDFERLPAEIPDAAARRQALVNRADILGGLAEYAASQSLLQLEIAKQYPDVHLSPGYEYDQGDNKWGVGLSLELPLLNMNRGNIAGAEARRKETAARFTVLQARVLSEIEQAVAGYRASVKKAGAARSLNEELAVQLQAAQGMFDAGEISRVELAQRQLELATATLAQLEALLQAQEALGALEDALQSPAALIPVPEQSPRHP